MPSNSPVVVARGLAHRYRSGGIGLEPTSLEIESGEVIALIGPNGSGKTTLLRLLATDLVAGAGELEILGRDARNADPTLRRAIGYASDHPVHVDALTGTENLRFFEALASGKPGEAHALAVEFELADALDEPVSSYSYGMRRRLLLSATLASRHPLLLLDEPALGLDPSGVAILGDRIRERAAEGSAVMLATNEVRDVPRWATRVLFLHRGRILVDGTPGDLLERVRGRTVLTLAVEGPFPDLTSLDGVVGPVEVVGSPGSFRLESSRGAHVLPEVIERILAEGGEVRTVQVREPDLRDAFLHFAGETLESVP